MKAAQLIKVLEIAVKNNFNTLVTGQPGCGKTEIIKQVVNNIGYDLLILHPVVSDPVDYKGFPFVNANGEADFVPFATLKMMIEAKKPLVCFFDDIGTAPIAVQASLMQIVWERKINGKNISKEVRFIAATNRRKDNAGVSNIITPLLNRFNTIIDFDLDANNWCQWALSSNIAIELISFIRFRPDLISTFKAEKDIKNFASPRSWENLNKWVSAGVIDNEVWSGCIGEAAAIEFFAFYSLFKKIAHIPDQVFQNPNKAEIPDKPDILFALTGVLSKRVNDVNVDNLFSYIDRLNPEYQTVIVSNIRANKPELQNTKCMVSWMVKNSDKI